MRSKKKTKPSKAMNAKPVDVEGHLMPAPIYAQFQSNLESRAQQSHLSADNQFRLALSETIYRYKPDARAKAICYGFHSMVSECGMGLGTRAEWPWFGKHNLMRLSGCDLLAKVAAQLESTARQMREFRGALLEEETTHLQDWLKLDARMDSAGQEPGSRNRS